MSDIAIRVDNLGKEYRIGSHQASYRTIRETLVDAFQAPFQRAGRLLQGQASGAAGLNETIWALKDVSFEIKQGEVVGVIGRNGAGKSTLLKILSRITEPTTGRVEIHGRVGSLLEVGTGFHPELTGRENIYLNGAILGMSRNTIERQFDEIVAFAEVEKFIDTPVKHYSSGMYLRLAFAVAAHLEPEILLVDEVLAVGDATFQKKCLGKMGEVAGAGRTVLFVSHNMGAITTLCQNALWIDHGRIAQLGPAPAIVNEYLTASTSTVGRTTWPKEQRPGNQSFELCSITLRSADGMVASSFNISQDIVVEVEYEVIKEGGGANFSLQIWNANGHQVLSSLSNTPENVYHGKLLPKGLYRSQCRLYGNLLNNDRYYVTLKGLGEYWSNSFLVENALAFDTLDDGVLTNDYSGRLGGVVRPKLVWKTSPLVDNAFVNVQR